MWGKGDWYLSFSYEETETQDKGSVFKVEPEPDREWRGVEPGCKSRYVWLQKPLPKKVRKQTQSACGNRAPILRSYS